MALVVLDPIIELLEDLVIRLASRDCRGAADGNSSSESLPCVARSILTRRDRASNATRLRDMQ